MNRQVLPKGLPGFPWSTKIAASSRKWPVTGQGWLALCGWLLLSTTALGSPQAKELSRKVGEGEQCIVCDMAIHGAEVVELQHKGRRFFVGEPKLEEFRANEDRYFQKVQSRSVLFDEASHEGEPMRSGWMIFGIVVLTNVAAAALCGYLAISKSLSAPPWFVAGLVGNVIAVGILLTRPSAADAKNRVPEGLRKVPLTASPVPCSRCGALLHPTATVCDHCGTERTPTSASEVQRAAQTGSQ